jgi:hypothetical protein
MELLCPLQRQYGVHLSPGITFNCRNQSRILIIAPAVSHFIVSYFLYAVTENVIKKCGEVRHCITFPKLNPHIFWKKRPRKTVQIFGNNHNKSKLDSGGN